MDNLPAPKINKSMDNLPPSLVLEILRRLPDSSDLARCRLASKTLNSLSYDVCSIKFICSFDRYIKSRASSSSTITPFKSIVNSFISKLSCVESITIGVDEVLQAVAYDDCEGDSDDLHLTDVAFVSEWLPAIAKELKFLSFCDFWVQSCWRRSLVLSFISRLCQRLSELQIKNAWLSIDGLSTMASLTSLTLEFVRIDDENLSKFNDCFPFLEIVNLIGVGGLKEPRISLQHLKRLRWTVSNVPLSLTIVAPNMVELKVKCVKPKSLIVETPLLANFHLTVDKAGTIDVGDLPCLKKLQLKSGDIHSLIYVFSCAKTVHELSIDSLDSTEVFKATKAGLDMLFDVFPNMSSLSLGPGAYSKLEACFGAEFDGNVGRIEEGLKYFTAYLMIKDVDVTLKFISIILKKCKKLLVVSFFIHHEHDSLIAKKLKARCMAMCTRVRWKWGVWKDGCQDNWVSNDL